jgi:phosphatidyl-myo-inositol dimannoside synthase
MMDTLDLLYVGTLPPHPGGSAVMSVQLLEGLERRGHSVRAIAPITEATLTVASAEPARLTDVRRYLVPRFATDPGVLPDPAARAVELGQIEPLFEEELTAHRPDVVIAGRESFSHGVSTLAARHGTPWLQIMHASRPAEILGGVHDASVAAEFLEPIRAADAVVTPARYVAAALERLGVDSVRVVPNPVDLARFRPRPASDDLRQRLDIAADALVVAHVSNLKPLKRTLDLAAAAGLVADGAPGLVYLVLGSGPDRGRLEASVAALGLGGRFRFVDWVDHELVPAYLNLADLVVMPSEREAQALVYLEAQACGRVLVASDIPASREVVEDGETGMLFPVGDTRRLAHLIAQLADDAQLRAGIGRKARARARLHAIESTVSGYETILLGLRSDRSSDRAAAGRRLDSRGRARSDVTAVLLSIGEESLERAYASIERQTVRPAEIISVAGVRPFYKALAVGAARVTTPFFIQVDADMVLDETCIERLRDAMSPELGIAVGQLRDPLMGTIPGVKVFRRECFDAVPMRDSITQDIDFFYELADLGWLTQHILLFNPGLGRTPHTFGRHLPDYTPPYTYSTYVLLGCRYFRRCDLLGLLWRYDSLRRSTHDMRLVARVALLAGLFVDEERDVGKDAVVADPGLLEGIVATTPSRQPSMELGSIDSTYALGRHLRRHDRFQDFRDVLSALESVPPTQAWTAEAALTHGFCTGTGRDGLPPRTRLRDLSRSRARASPFFSSLPPSGSDR